MSAPAAAPRTALPPETAEEVAARLVELGAVAVLRLGDAETTLAAARAILAGGVLALEVTLTTPGALEVIERLAAEAGEGVLVGAGSVLDRRAARRAIAAGARFVVSPVSPPGMVEEGHGRGAAVLPGAFTPTEILHAHEAGADLVKLFPSEALSPAYLRGVLAPLPFLRLLPTGGVTVENAGEWLRAGAAAVGVGGALADPRLAAAGDLAAITARARRLAENVASARQRSGGGA